VKKKNEVKVTKPKVLLHPNISITPTTAAKTSSRYL
jgi:hypothetical protein